MVAEDEPAVICDFLQYYHVMDYRSLSVQRAAILACGLPEQSRIAKHLRGDRPDPEKLYKYAVLDTLKNINWAIYQAHSREEIERPESLVEKLLNKNKEGNSQEGHQEVKGFSTPEEFNKAWNS